MTALSLKKLLIAMLAVFGITVPMPVFFSGLVLALAGAGLAYIWSKDESRGHWLGVLGTAALLCVLTAYIHQSWFPELNLRLMMFGTGFFSRFIVKLGLSIGGSLSGRGVQIVDALLERFGIKKKDDET